MREWLAVRSLSGKETNETSGTICYNDFTYLLQFVHANANGLVLTVLFQKIVSNVFSSYFVNNWSEMVSRSKQP